MAETFRPTTYFTAKTALNQVTNEIYSAATRLEGMRRMVAEVDRQVDVVFALEPEGYQGVFDYIEEQAAAAPENATWQNLKQQKDMVTADFRAFSARVKNIALAIQDV